MVKGSSNRDGEGRVGKYLAHGLKIRRASFTVRCISTNSVYEGDETEEGGIFSLTSPSLCRPFFSFYSALGPRWNNTGFRNCAGKKCSFADAPGPDRPRYHPSLCMNIVKLFVPKCKAGIGGRREGVLIRVTSSFLLCCLYYANYYCRLINFFFFFFLVSSHFHLFRIFINTFVFISVHYNGMILVRIPKVLFENFYNIWIEIECWYICS